MEKINSDYFAHMPDYALKLVILQANYSSCHAFRVCSDYADILVPEHEEIAISRPGLFLPRSAHVQLEQSLFIGRMIVFGFDDDYLPKARSHDKIWIVVDKAIDGEPRSRDIAMPPPDIG